MWSDWPSACSALSDCLSNKSATATDITPDNPSRSTICNRLSDNRIAINPFDSALIYEMEPSSSALCFISSIYWCGLSRRLSYSATKLSLLRYLLQARKLRITYYTYMCVFPQTHIALCKKTLAIGLWLLSYIHPPSPYRTHYSLRARNTHFTLPWQV